MTENLLIHETSPYLLQHKNNPVHWYPWGEKAFEAAKAADKPILVSIGYAACHWCHVMAHESFEDQQTAELMNENFINIKIDREEFPDVDKLYMDALHAFGERGGWPLTVFLEHDGSPFWGGTYFPKTPQYGRPSFSQILNGLSQTWNLQRQKISANKTAIIEALQKNQPASQQDKTLSVDMLPAIADQIVAVTDQTHGGLSGAPKFPQTTIYNFLWRMYLNTGNETYRQCVVKTLTHLCQGGIYDHLGGGFARYSVDERWLVPHFEKMLYDNALIVDLLTLVNNTENNILFRKRIEETIGWLVSEMITDEATFAASYDADSQGQEGTYYIWSYQEVLSVIPEANRNLFCNTYDITESGNWEGKNIPNRLNSLDDLDHTTETRLDQAKKSLLSNRSKRPKPGWDDKTLTDWNGLTIAMLCNAGFALSRYDWIDKACAAYLGVKQTLWGKDYLEHAYRQGKTTNIATSDDYANLIKAALSLYQATNTKSYLDDACKLTGLINDFHWNDQTGGYYFASSKAKNLLVRSSSAHDDATPNANGTMLTNLVKLYLLTGNTAYDQKANAILQAFSTSAISAPLAHTGLLTGFLDIAEPLHAVLVIPDTSTKIRPLVQALQSARQPITLMVVSQQSTVPELHPAKGKTTIDNKPTVYICKGRVCSKPITDLSTINEVISDL